MKQNQFILKMYDGGVTLHDICKAFNKTNHEVIKILYDIKINKKGIK